MTSHSLASQSQEGKQARTEHSVVAETLSDPATPWPLQKWAHVT
jgi:hypothetical protein